MSITNEETGDISGHERRIISALKRAAYLYDHQPDEAGKIVENAVRDAANAEQPDVFFGSPIKHFPEPDTKPRQD